jgi:t-SNARE complex subunit (syntaxin)
MQNIESTVVELGGIFQQLAHMVKEQEEMVERLAFQGYWWILRNSETDYF